jgi:peptidoglycan/xylan/chitin deacetylase (PgdA/CDA1 family)
VSRATQILPVLCYHDIHEGDGEKDLSIAVNQFNLQLKHLKENGYNTISIKQLLDYWDDRTVLPPKPVLLTFDDGYKSMTTILYPLLQQFKMKATVFILPHYVYDKKNGFVNNLTLEQIKNTSPQWLEWGIHSYDHKNFKKLQPAEVKEDLIKCIDWFNINNIPFVKAFAFPFGAFQKNNLFKRIPFFKAVAAAGIKISFRLGNRINFLGNNKPAMLQRIDIKGNETLAQFEKYLSKGKKKTIRQIFGLV